MDRREVKQLQRGINYFCRRYLDGMAPLFVDGRMGRATRARIRLVKYYLGYAGTAGSQNDEPDRAFRSRMWHPKSPRYSSPARIRRGMARRRAQRAAYRKNRSRGSRATGVGRFDGRPCANWLIPYLTWARANGWRGTLNSGWRDPVYSEGLCYRMCGAPSCSGRCAGRNSNHSGSVRPRGAVDVSDYATFGRVIGRCPYGPRIFNALGARDPVHFSASGN